MKIAIIVKDQNVLINSSPFTISMTWVSTNFKGIPDETAMLLEDPRSCETRAQCGGLSMKGSLPENFSNIL